jgi:amino acid adenylation domain-containing protein
MSKTNSNREQKHTLSEWNDTQEPAFLNHTFLQLFAQQAAQTPQATAVTSTHPHAPTLTYHQLDHHSSQLAHQLQAHGAAPGQFVAVLMERRVDMLVALLAILKSGAAYLPLDPTYPQERLAWMLDDAQPCLLLAHSASMAHRPHLPTTPLFILDDWAPTSETSTILPATAVTPTDPAYLIYTSGSTGKPKGVLISHRALANFLQSMRRQPGLTATDKLLAVTTISFDISILELFLPLIVGATVVIAEQAIVGDGLRLAQAITTHHITHMQATPLTWWLLIASGWAGAPHLTILCGGEALPRNLADLLLPRCHALWNMYGPTETTIWSGVQLVTAGAAAPRLGPPIANTQFWVLDEQRQLLPPGEVGELYISGDGLADGYFQRPDLTAERFVLLDLPAPYGRIRAYQTGDLVRPHPDGTLDFLGRSDRQIKLHGYRIELGEIEAVLQQHTAVAQTIVISREDTPGVPHLVAYIIPQTSTADLTTLRPWLLAKLPAYMVPAAFVPLAEFPRTPNGKIDRRALPAPANTRPLLPTPYIPPQSEMHKKLVTLWEEILAIQGIGIHDNFFELGGDSLQGAIFINRLQEELGSYLYIVALFEAPTIAQFADYLAAHYTELAITTAVHTPLTPAHLNQLRQLIRPLSPLPTTDKTTAPILFILAPPRSGSTLLRVMLAGHPALFAPPELDLLTFTTLAERQEQLAAIDHYRLEGAIRALMQLHTISATAAETMLQELIANGRTIPAFYHQLQAWAAPRTLVDKSTFYPLNPAVLARAAACFPHAQYIHLTRHPYGTIYSFADVRLDRLYFHDQPHNFPPRQLAELIWLLAHENILTFLQTIPASQQIRLSYEKLVRQPQVEMSRLAHFLHIPPHPALWQPYDDPHGRMTDGIHQAEQSRMVGDVRFHEHRTIDPEQADRWQARHTTDFLSEMSWQMAQQLGYPRPVPTAELDPTQAAALLDQLDNLSDEEVAALLEAMGQAEGMGHE